MDIIFDNLTDHEFFFYKGEVILNDGTVIDDYDAFKDVLEKSSNLPDIKECKLFDKKYYYDTLKSLFVYDAVIKTSEKDTYGIKNVNFTLIDGTDDRWEYFKKQRLERGFDESETWCLSETIAKFIYPRIKEFSEICPGYPGRLKSEKEWQEILKKIVFAFQLIANVDQLRWTEEQKQIVQEGLDLFREWYFALWW